VPQRIAAASAAWCAASFEKRAVDQLEEDAAILLNRFDRIGGLAEVLKLKAKAESRANGFEFEIPARQAADAVETV